MNFQGEADEKKIFSLMSFLIFASSLWPSAAAKKGLEIAEKSSKSQDGFIGESAIMTMILINAYGDRVERTMKV